MRNIKLIYDASVILSGEKSYSARTGIYFCSCNILKKLKSHSGIDIYLYSSDERLIPISKNIEILKGLPFIKFYDTSACKKNIHSYIKSIFDSKNIFLICLAFLKIIKNNINIFYGIIRFHVFSKRRLQRMDAFFCLYYFYPHILNSFDIKKFILIYDILPILFPDHYEKDVISAFKDNMTNFVTNETYCFFISECTKKDFHRYFGKNLDEDKMTVTYIASANEFEPKHDKSTIGYIENKYKVNIDQNKYVFSFCLLDHRKNLIFTVNCFIKFIQKNNITDLCFLLGGVQYDNFAKCFNETFGELHEDLQSKIVRLGYVDDSDVNMLYSNSLFFAYISQYEGFGMPLLEAMQAGTPVITANNSSMPEVVGGAALTIDYNDEEACIKAMEAYYFDEDLRQAYIKKGFERAKLFTWDKTVNLMVNKIKEVIGNSTTF